MGNYLGKIFLAVLHDHEDQVTVIEPAASRLRDPNQAGMLEFPRHLPARELEVRVGCIRRYQLARGRLRRLPVVLGEKHSAELRPPQVLLEFKCTVDNMAFPL